MVSYSRGSPVLASRAVPATATCCCRLELRVRGAGRYRHRVRRRSSATWLPGRSHRRYRLMVRNFYGALRVRDNGPANELDRHPHA